MSFQKLEIKDNDDKCPKCGSSNIHEELIFYYEPEDGDDCIRFCADCGFAVQGFQYFSFLDDWENGYGCDVHQIPSNELQRYYHSIKGVETTLDRKLRRW